MMMGGKKKSGRSTTPSDKKAEEAVLAIRKKENPIYPFEDVAQLQEALIAAGYKLPKYGADGKWGKETEVALQAFTKSGRRYSGAFEPKAVYGNEFSTGLNALAKAAAKDPSLLFRSKDSGSRLYCNIIEFACPPGWECVPAFGPDQAPSGWEDVGLCIPEELIDIGHIPQPTDYVPGGFNEIFVDPKTKKVFIGGGWNFGTLHPWLRTPEYYVLPTLRNLGGLFKHMLNMDSAKSGEIVRQYFPNQPPNRAEIEIAWRSFWFDKMADSLKIHERYSRWPAAWKDSRAEALSGGPKFGHTWEDKILSCPDFGVALSRIYGRFSSLRRWGLESTEAAAGDYFMLMGRWLFAQAASHHLTVRYGNKTIRIIDLQSRSEKAYQKVMNFIAGSLCKYQRMSMDR